MSDIVAYKIRKATEDDIAVYEKEPDAVVATPELLRKNVFQDHYAEVLLVHAVGPSGNEVETVGMSLYFFTFSTWLGAPGIYLEDLYVKPEHRAHGLGKRLFGELGAVAKERGCQRIEWRVLKWNKPSIDFYVERLKADNLSEWDTMRIEGDERINKLIEMRQ
ncbi:hypothetical protein TREMEDRAFT_25423 [Tremella mesenterica DSM 1558]|uniref:uncharacterized protein n=1 Tax=Tremella mesenterica (strain ATCC 24925 / CBS 8224 / DSM 1558 / NBRC 9311 / NRRL Y-6157 / RJB 2259-6 / UBC 559-6) TaxID=578456 RepID=UPI0003F49355|nr:uncharacterized protein TREMEDRAFT_25423 [Tremella mesenterica DSM 1558]EIW72715.1 hypothetical protein TREMEDRAFT_25423 [Tremella mesenterica DSM 1558]